MDSKKAVMAFSTNQPVALKRLAEKAIFKKLALLQHTKLMNYLHPSFKPKCNYSLVEEQKS